MEEKTEEKNEDKKTLKLPIWLVILIAFLGSIFLLYASLALYTKMKNNRRNREIRMQINKHNKMLLAQDKKKLNNRSRDILNKKKKQFYQNYPELIIYDLKH